MIILMMIYSNGDDDHDDQDDDDDDATAVVHRHSKAVSPSSTAEIKVVDQEKLLQRRVAIVEEGLKGSSSICRDGWMHGCMDG
jgi:hypothetical protein